MMVGLVKIHQSINANAFAAVKGFFAADSYGVAVAA
jgi:hypothetical protein